MGEKKEPEFSNLKDKDPVRNFIRESFGARKKDHMKALKMVIVSNLYESRIVALVDSLKFLNKSA